MTRDNLPELDPAITQRIPYGYAKRHGVIGARMENDTLHIISRGRPAAMVLAELGRSFECTLSVDELEDSGFNRVLNAAYERGTHQAAAIADDVEGDLDLDAVASSLSRVEDLLDSEDEAPVIRLINALLSQAVRDNASDIHLEPYETRSVVRFRLDGVLRDIMDLKNALHGVLASRIKVMARMDIAEKRLPQDGRIALRLAGRPVDVRVSTLPTAHGERIVLRLLDKQAGRLQLEGMGMAEDTLAAVRALVHHPHGIVLVTGPTGSGKTTTLYAALAELDTHRLNIMTVEDPIEYDLEGIGQTQVNSKIDLDFARALRALLRQDPDVIMIGEIRDLETAQIAVQASLTGHLVLATLHTNDAPGAITRLVDMGVEPFLVASSLLGVVAQRLVRRLCPACRTGITLSAAELAALELEKPGGKTSKAWHATGCEQCNHTGYAGRTGIFELLRIDDALRQRIHDGAAEAELRQYAIAQGMRTLRQDGMRWIETGVTGAEEVLRVTRE